MATSGGNRNWKGPFYSNDAMVQCKMLALGFMNRMQNTRNKGRQSVPELKDLDSARLAMILTRKCNRTSSRMSR